MRYLVTGGSGFLGKNLQSILPEGSSVFVSSDDGDLRSYKTALNLINAHRPEIIIHAAANVGGIWYNNTNPYDIMHDNLLINTNMIDAFVKSRNEVKKFVLIGTICSYPRSCFLPLREMDLFNGLPEITNAPYGIAKRAAMMQLNSARLQYGKVGITVMPTNMYGPHDDFSSHRSHVIPALIDRFNKAIEFDENVVKVWGTGQATRDFLYVKDAARLIKKLADDYEGSDPVNIGPGVELRIAVIAKLISKQLGYTGAIQFDTSKPDGQPRRAVDNTALFSAIGSHYDFVSIESGLRDTIKWYKENV